MSIKNKNAIDDFIMLVENADFSLISYPHLPAPKNNRIAEVLSIFFKANLSGRSGKHPLIQMAVDCTSLDQREIPLFPLFQLKVLGSVLSYIDDIDNNNMLDSFKKRLSSFKTYNQTLFELQVGCILKNNDSEIDFYEISNPDALSPPDFHKKMSADKSIWIDAFVRKRKKTFLDHFERDDKGIPIPKTEDEIDEILKDFVKTTCSVISKKRKHSIAENDIFVAAVRVSDGYSSGSINYQVLVNSLSHNDVVVVFEGPTALYVGDNVVKDRVTIYFNELNNFNKDEIFFIRNIFS